MIMLNNVDLIGLILVVGTLVALSYGAGKIGFKNLWGFDDDQSDSNVIKFIDGRYVRPNRKAQ
ncbi:hypothetical protein [Latilactobacillus curvatus]|uniref:hypothetical protein n=1 Tax=Latilactobacillus curvatus TaxID=28038 RepID=UPI00280AA267|nr:hypothetical protein [Latilactobacillus curvatus]